MNKLIHIDKILYNIKLFKLVYIQGWSLHAR